MSIIIFLYRQKERKNIIMSTEKLGVIGLGNMATAIMTGVIESGSFESSTFRYFDTDIKRDAVANGLGIMQTNGNEALAEECKYILLAVKPDTVGSVLVEIRDTVTPNTVIISIVAGISSKDIRVYLGKDCKVIRAMPNTPIMVKRGVTALCHNSLVTDEEFQFATDLFSCSGIVETIPETKMNEIVAVHGSTPAYIALISKYFCEYASEQGIPYETANKLFAETLIGTAKLMTETDYTQEEIIEQISTPNGATERGIDALNSWALQGAIFDCCEATIRRTYELAEENAVQ